MARNPHHQHEQRQGTSANQDGRSNAPSASNAPPSSSPYTYNRLANAAAAAASPILGYLSGATQQPSTSSAGNPGQTQQQSSQFEYNTSARPSHAPLQGTSGGTPAARGVAPPPPSSAATTSRRSYSGTAVQQDTQYYPSLQTSGRNAPDMNRRNSMQDPNSMRRTPSASGQPQPPSSQGPIMDEEARKKESRNLDSIVFQFFSKAAQVITQARFTHLSTASDPAAGAAKKSRNRWFNIEMDESDVFKDELRAWKSVTTLLVASTSTESSLSGSSPRDSPSIARGQPSNLAVNAANNYTNVPSMVIEIILDVSDISANQVLVLNNTRDGKRFRVDLSGRGRTTHVHNPAGSLEGSAKKCNIVLERWTLDLKPASSPANPLELPTVYKHCIILFRALYTLVRALPIFELQRRLKRRTGRSEIKVGCRLSMGESGAGTGSVSSAEDKDTEDRSEISLSQPLGEDDDSSFSVQDFAFAPIVTPIGSLDLRCRYRSCVNFSVEEIEALLSSRFIDEDFFKPTMRKYSSSTGAGSLPIRGSAPASAPQAYSQGQRRPSYASPSALAKSPTQPTFSTSPQSVPPPDPDQGAFVGQSRTPGAEVVARIASRQGSPAVELSRRPSIGTSHPFKPSSPSPAQGVPRSYTTSPAQEGTGRYSASPASIGPSSSLRYSYGVGRTPSVSSGPAGPSASQLSYTKRSIPSPTSGQPPVSGLAAMNIGRSPSTSASPAPGSTQPMPVPGTSAIPLSSSPTPSLIKRYSTSRYSRSFGQGSSGSSPGDPQGFWGPESLGRRSRLSSAQSREEMQAAGGMAAQARRRSANLSDLAAANTQDADQIKSFLGMIDSRAQLSPGSVLLGGNSSPARSAQRNAALSRLQAEEKLRNLADSVLRDAPGQSGPSPLNASPSSAGSGPGLSAYTRSAPAAHQLGHTRSRSGEFVAPLPPSSRQSPSPDLYSASPVEGQLAAARARLSQRPMSTSIPEEDSHHVIAASGQRQPESQSSSLAGSTGPPVGGSGAQFPFPRYVSSAMRRRGSSQSSGPRPSFDNSTSTSQRQGSSISSSQAAPAGSPASPAHPDDTARGRATDAQSMRSGDEAGRAIDQSAQFAGVEEPAHLDLDTDSFEGPAPGSSNDRPRRYW